MPNPEERIEVELIRENVLKEYADVFSDDAVPTMKGLLMVIKLNDGATPCRVNGPRAIPFAYRDQVQRPTHPMRNPRDTIAILENARFLFTLDARHRCWQVPLAPESRHLTTFITPWGRYRFLRNPQGFVAAGNKFNQRTDQAFEGIGNFAQVVDDCLVHDAPFNDHVKRVRSVLQCARENGITFSKKKFAFAPSEVQLCGYFVREGGWRMDPERTSALGQFPTPTTHTDLRSFLGLVNQFGDFSDEIAKLTQPLRSLLKANSEFLLNQDHDAAMLNIKSFLLRTPTLAYYEFGAPTRLETDASRNNGLGYALLPLQGGKWRLIQCGSRFISDTESRYGMIELEQLAIAWAMKKCHVYLFATKFEVITDNQPLIPIMNKYSLMEIENPRIRRMLLKLQGYL